MNDAPRDPQPWNYSVERGSNLPAPTPAERRQAIAEIRAMAPRAEITEADIRRQADIIRRRHLGQFSGRGEPADAAAMP